MKRLNQILFLSLQLVALIVIASPKAFAELDRFGQLDANVSHGSQPATDEDYAELKAKGVKTILNLRWDASVAASQAAAEVHGFKFLNFPIHANKPIPQDQIDGIFAAFKDPAYQPVYFHCEYGRDRTGMIAALYRVKVQGMAPEDAYLEWENVLGYRDVFFVKSVDDYFRQATGFTGPSIVDAKSTGDRLPKAKSCKSSLAPAK